MAEEDRSKYVIVPIEQTTEAPNGMIWHFKDHWWAVAEDGVLFYARGRRDRYPQCNQNEAITRKLAPSWAEVRFVPSVFVRVNPEGELQLSNEIRLA